jgi:hypothetical protein
MNDQPVRGLSVTLFWKSGASGPRIDPVVLECILRHRGRSLAASMDVLANEVAVEDMAALIDQEGVETLRARTRGSKCRE